MTATPSVNVYVSYPGSQLEPSFFDAIIKSVSIINPAYPATESIYDAWCLDEKVQIQVNTTYASFVYSAYETGLLQSAVPTLAKSAYLNNLDSINWLLNWYDGKNATYGDVQGAMWKLMGINPLASYLGPQSIEKIDALVQMALANDGYVPGAGGVIGVVLDPMQGTTHRQPLIIEMKAAQLGDRVWHDANANGMQDAGEAGIAGATVKLVRDQNLDGDVNDAFETIATTTTDASGAYVFKGLTPGLNYQVQFSLPAGFDAVSPRQLGGSASGANSDALLSNIVVLAPGENNSGIDAGFYKAAQLGDRLWLDANGNGQQDAGEAGIAGQTVTLIGGGLDGRLATTLDNTSTQVVTRPDGAYAFGALKPGVEYQVQFDKPAGAVFTAQDRGDDAGDSDAGATGLSQVVVLASGETNTSIDAGVYVPASLGDKVWLDANGNGVQDGGEAGVAGVTVTLTGGGADGLLATEADNTTAKATTGADGKYGFNNLTPGVEYQVSFDAPAGAVFTAPDRGGDAGDSDADQTGRAPVVVLASGETNTSIDAGLYVPARLGDKVWLDADGNGQQDAGEAGVGGVTVTLTGGGADGLLATLDDNTTSTVTTATDGSYAFAGLAPGQYQVRFDAPHGAVFTARDKGADNADSDADVDGLTQVVTLGSGQVDNSIDAGIYVPASLGDRVWLDANGNGVQDAGEAGAAGVTVTLTGGGADGLLATSADNVKVQTVTGADGSYAFTGLTPGVEYRVQVEAPAGATFTSQDEGSDTGDSDVNTPGISHVVRLDSGENDTSIDAGFYVPASLGDRLWLDANGNGLQDAGERGIAGQTVTLTGGGADGKIATGADNITLTTTTDAGGNYRFDGLAPGMQYQVRFSAPAGAVFTGRDAGDDAADSDADSAGVSHIVTLAGGENNDSIDAGVYLPAALGDKVWLDANVNGRQDAGEAGVAGVTVTLTGGGADGLLATSADNITLKTTTDAAGAYRFADLAPGQYQVGFTAPSGSVYTAQDLGGDAGDSDAAFDGLTQVVTLASGDDDVTIDGGLYAPASLGDRVWRDTNGNGRQDAGEAGIAGLTVTLIGGGADGLLATEADNTSASVTTGADGAYLFEQLLPGVQYQVQFSKPDGTVFTRANEGTDTADSDAGETGLSQVVTLASGEENRSIDAGIYAPASLGDRLWLDANGNGTQDAGETGIAGQTVTLTGGGADGLLATTGDNTETSTVTGADGEYAFADLTPGVQYQVRFSAPEGAVFTARDKGNDTADSDADAGGATAVVTLASGEANTSIDAGVYHKASLGDRVWFDDNGNGVQDAGEAGIAGLTVTLIGGGADGLLSTTANNTSVSTVTGADGAYAFADLAPGEYQVQFSKEAGTMFTRRDAGDDGVDSDAGANGLSQVVKLASGDNNRTIDAGVVIAAALGNRLWLDANANGQQDEGESGIAGQTVTLTGGGADGLIATTGDNTSATTTTGVDGAYKFANLTPGVQYQVTFAKPADTVFTRQDGAGDAADSDVSSAGKSQVVTLVSGEYNDSIDAGVYGPASIGDRLWVDANANGVQDAGEAGMSGRTVTLLGGGADGLLSTTADNTKVSQLTGADGIYNFTNLTPGVEYQVQFSKPTGYLYTFDTGADDLTNSDADSSTGLTRVVVLGSGEHNKKLDAGIVNVTGDLSVTKTDGVSTVLPGQTVTYTIVVKNTGTAIAADALVTDSLPATLTNVTWTSSASAGAYGNIASGSGSISDYVTLFGGASVTYTVTGKMAHLAELETVADFSARGNNINLGQNTTVEGVRADAFYLSSGYQTTSTVLWGRNTTGEEGLGVWSKGETNPATTGGDADELSNQLNKEVIRLTKAAGEKWSSLWVSSLDSDGSGDVGTLYWSNSATPDLATLTTKFTFKSGDFGLGEGQGDLLSLRPAGFDANAKYLFFVAGNGTAGSTGDFLVWKAGTVPATLSNTAGVTAPGYFIDTNAANNSATDTDTVVLPTPAAVVRGSVGDRVWEDKNFNGIQDTGEAGIANVTVKLLNSAGSVIGTTTTNSSGNYLFSNLNAGSYQVEVVAPSGYYATKKDAGGSAATETDSDIDAGTGRTDSFILGQGENWKNIDAGLYRKASIGDKVFRDADHDDIQDAGEEGIGGVKVMLYSASNVLLASTVTNSTGNYKFSNLDPGSYWLKFDKTNVVFKTYEMNNWMWASKNIGADDAIDSDVNGDGVAKTNVTRTDVTTLVSGENDMSWDAGITPIVIDLNGDGVRTLARDASSATFDLLGNGSPVASGWLSGQDGFLAVDSDGNGAIDGIGELFGGSARGAGFARLAAYDSNGDGMVDALDADFASLRIWVDANGNHATDAGELLGLMDAGVLSLKVAHVDLPFVDARGNLHLERSSAVLAGGQVVDMTDVYFAVSLQDAGDADVAGIEELLGDLALPAVAVTVGVQEASTLF